MQVDGGHRDSPIIGPIKPKSEVAKKRTFM